MSLTSFIKKNPDVRERFKKEFRKPQFRVKRPVLAPPLTKRYSTIGTAFDYLLRFYVKRLNAGLCKCPQHWIAEYSLALLQVRGGELYGKALKVLARAKAQESKFLASGQVTDELIASVLALAYLDPIFRAGRGVEYIGASIDSRDIEDVRRLISIVQPEMFVARERCLLNPHFGEASALVSGADADLIIDDNLIDIKTTKNLELRMADFHQLMGYYVLYQISGIGGLQPKPEIRKVSIYFARYAYLHTIEVKSLINEESFPNFIRWFIKRAESEYGSLKAPSQLG